MNTITGITTNSLSIDTTATIVESLLREPDYTRTPSIFSDRMDATIAILETLGYTYDSRYTAAGVTTATGHPIHGHTNGNTYTMVSPNRELYRVVYLARENGSVSV